MHMYYSFSSKSRLATKPNISVASLNRDQRGNSELHASQSGSDNVRRAPRPKYTTQEDVALLYFRDTINLRWKEVQHYVNRFAKRSILGLQSRYYRLKLIIIVNKKLEREGKSFYVLNLYSYRYWWMYATNFQAYQELARGCRGDHSHPRMLAEFKKRIIWYQPRKPRIFRQDTRLSHQRPDNLILQAQSFDVSDSSISPQHVGSSDQFIQYKPNATAQDDDDSQSVIDHSMEGLDSSSRYHTFRVRSSKI